MPSTSHPQEGSYRAQSPTTGKRQVFNDEEIEREVQRIFAEADAAGFPRIQSLAQQAPVFCHPDRLLTPQAREWTSRYNLWQMLKVPLAPTLDEVPARFARAVQVIETETENAIAFKAES